MPLGWAYWSEDGIVDVVKTHRIGQPPDRARRAGQKMPGVGRLRPLVTIDVAEFFKGGGRGRVAGIDAHDDDLIAGPGIISEPLERRDEASSGRFRRDWGSGRNRE